MSKNAKITEGVSIIGLGPMGQAMARTLLANGHPVTVWNRTVSKADVLAKEGAIRVDTVSELLQANQLIILSLTDYQAMYDILGAANGALKGRTIVNLSSDTPDKSRKAAAWLADRGAELIVGGIMVPAELVGKDGAYVFYSGPRRAFDAHQMTLRLIGRPDYVGEDHALAQLYYQAQLDIFLTSLASYLHATALLGAAGVSAAQFLPYATDNFNSLSMYLADAAREIDTRHYPGDLANVTMMGATADHIVGASRAAGIDIQLPNAVKSLYDRAIAAGHGKDGWTSLVEVIKSRQTDFVSNEKIRNDGDN